MYTATRSTAEVPVLRLGLSMVGSVTADETRVAPPYAMSEPGWSSSLVASQRDSDGIDLDATVHLKAVGGGFQPAN